MSLLPSPLKSPTCSTLQPVPGQQATAADHAQPIHQPDCSAAVGVLPDDVTLAVAVEIIQSRLCYCERSNAARVQYPGAIAGYRVNRPIICEPRFQWAQGLAAGLKEIPVTL